MSQDLATLLVSIRSAMEGILAPWETHQALVFLFAWYGTFGSALYLVLRAMDVRSSLRRAREPRMVERLP